MVSSVQLSTWTSKVVFPRFQVLMAFAMNLKALYNINERLTTSPSRSFYWAANTTILPRRR